MAWEFREGVTSRVCHSIPNPGWKDLCDFTLEQLPLFEETQGSSEEVRYGICKKRAEGQAEQR